MEDVMETCYLDSVTMCVRGYKCETCPKDKANKLKLTKCDEELKDKEQ